MTKQYKIEGRTIRGNWDADVVGNDPAANTFDTIADAEAMIPELINNFAGDNPAPTRSDFRVIER